MFSIAKPRSKRVSRLNLVLQTLFVWRGLVRSFKAHAIEERERERERVDRYRARICG